MKKGQVYEGEVTSLHFPNKATVEVDETQIADVQGREKRKTATVKGALPGQKVRFLAKKVRGEKVQGNLQSVLMPSPIETEQALCPQFGACGGCSYQTLSYESQLQLKEKQVKELIDDVVTDYEWEGILASPLTYQYRNKMEFTFGDAYKDGPLTLGMHKRNSFHDIVPASCCKLVHEDMERILACIQEYCRQRGYTYYHRMSHQGYLRHLLVRHTQKTGEILLAIVTTTQTEGEWTDLVEELIALPIRNKIVGILHVCNDSLADVVQSDKTELLYGRDFFYEELLGLRFRISPFSFFQTNTLGAEVLYKKVRSYIVGDGSASKPADKADFNLADNIDLDLADKTIYDLYSGTGTIAQILAPVARKVIGVEIVEEAVLAARENARENELTNCEFIAGDVLTVLDDIEEKPDLIVLDPPRDGLHPKVLPKIIAYGVDRLLYISCKPTSLARDLVILQEQGYKVERVCAVDMFPQTVHVETVCELSLKNKDLKMVCHT